MPQTRPRRTPGGIYRTADHEKTGLGGVTLASAEDRMVAAVRMAYDIADSQIARTRRLADRLKGAADRATGADPDRGQKSAEDAVDAAGRLVNNALLSGMSWFEALMSADDGLGPRLAAAQLRAAKGVLFGAAEPADRAEAPSAGGPPTPEATVPGVRILLPKPPHRRAIRIVRWDIDAVIAAELSFRFVGPATRSFLQARLKPPDEKQVRPTLEMISTPHAAPAGSWRAAVCDAHGEQFGIVEIEI